MSVSPYTLQNLYNQGILDYAPMELAGSTNVSSLTSMQNPYLNMAMQGNLYQNAGIMTDSFCHNKFDTSQIGMNGFRKINGNVGFNNSQAGINALGGVNGNMLFNYSKAGINGFGGGLGKLGQTVSNTPNIVKGLIAGGIIIGTSILCLKKGKIAPVKQPNNINNLFRKLKFWKK